MKKKRRKRKVRGKAKPIGDEAKLIAEYVETLKEISREYYSSLQNLSYDDKKAVDRLEILEQAKKGLEGLIGTAISEADSPQGLEKAIACQLREKGEEELRVIEAYRRLLMEAYEKAGYGRVTETDLLFQLYGTEWTPSQRSNVRYFVKRNNLFLFPKRPLSQRELKWLLDLHEVLQLPKRSVVK